MHSLPGQALDLDYMHARYFSAHLGRFHSPDPLNGSIQTPQSWNRFSYVLGNPLKYVDPFGLFPCPGLPQVDCQDIITVTGADPLTRAQGLRDLQTGNFLMRWIERGLGATRQLYQRRFEEAAVNDHYLAAFIDYVGLELIIPQSSEQLGTDILLTVVPFGKAGKLGKIGTRNVHGGKTSVRAVLNSAERWLGPGYKEVAPGVYRSADGTRQFRMTTDDRTDATGPHVHFEAVAPGGRQFVENAHVYLVDP